jgi:1-aminocyclopropane-1-carboxylate synthase
MSGCPLYSGVVVTASIAVASISYYLYKNSSGSKNTGRSEINVNADVSERMKKRLLSGDAGMSYIPDFLAALGNKYDEKTNPKGMIAMCVAENNLETHQMMADKMTAVCKDIGAAEEDILNYTATTGLPSLRIALARFFEKYLRWKPTGTIDSNNITVTSGAAAALSMLSMALFEEGDSVLVPTPYYAGFDGDFYSVGGVVRVGVTPCDKYFSLDEAGLEDAYRRALAQGSPPKALLLSNPNNPVGFMYPADQLQLAVKWCRSRSLHLIVDEVFSLSYFDTSCPFTSVVQALGEEFGPDVHVIWAFSKDMCGSGLRLGTLYSVNKQVNEIATSLNIFSMVSNLMQVAAQRILLDSEWLDRYIPANQAALRASYEALTKAMSVVQVRVAPTQGGVFAWCDFSNHLSAPTFEAERELYTAIKDAGVILTPGESFHSATPGCFRVCFAWVSIDKLEVALKRIIRGLVKSSVPLQLSQIADPVSQAKNEDLREIDE